MNLRIGGMESIVINEFSVALFTLQS